MIRFGRPSAALLRHKQSFFEENERLLAENHRLADLYTRQPCREACKNCTSPLGPTSFIKLGVAYSLCARCGHLNGAHEDTDTFCTAVYTEAGGKAYAETYNQQDRDAYRRRVEDIYRPKAEFLRDALVSRSVDPSSVSVADFGAGSGYFLAAADSCGFRSVRGFEVSEAQIELASAMLGSDRITHHTLDEVAEIAAGIDDEIVSMIGVLEHLQYPRAMLQSVRNNPKIRFVYMSLPLFSTTVLFELVFQSVMQRHLSGGHTHLYTNSSIDWLCQEFGFERIAEWWFGSDLVDLHRAVSVSLSRTEGAESATSLWVERFLPALDAMQLELDKRKLSSEVHLLLRSKS